MEDYLNDLTHLFKKTPMRPSLMRRHKCASLDELHTQHAPVLKRMVQLNSLRVLILGDPGTGKSTICRLVVKEYYGDEGGENVLHISSLNDQGIHFYRNDVRTFCQTTCSLLGKKKMVVLDDMDAMVESGQQVFLSYMDTFPRTLFLVTATNPLKIVSGVYSRLLSLKLAPFPPGYLRRELDRIAALEGLAVDPDAADAVVSRAGHSMRTLLNFLEKIILLGKGLTSEVVDACSTLDVKLLESFSAAVEAGNEYEAMDVVVAVHRDGYSVMDILDAYFAAVKHASLPDSRKYEIIKVIAKYIAIFNQHEHVIELLFCIHDLCSDGRVVRV